MKYHNSPGSYGGVFICLNPGSSRKTASIKRIWSP